MDAREVLFDALGRSSEVRDDDVGLFSDNEGRGEGDTAPDIFLIFLQYSHLLAFDSGLSRRTGDALEFCVEL